MNFPGASKPTSASYKPPNKNNKKKMSLPNIGEVIMLMGDHGSENHRQRDIRDEAERWLDSVTFPSGGDATRVDKAASRAASPGSTTISTTSGSQKKCNRNKTLHQIGRAHV